MILPIGLFLIVVLNAPDTTKTTTSTVTPIERLASTGNRAHDQLMAHSDNEQALPLGQAVQKGCVGNRAFYMGMDKEMDAYWSVSCLNGASYQVQINADATGTTMVLECSVLAAATNIHCFTKLKQQ